ncbi:MAG: preprotein translocase subunit SecA [Clostridia bacterium]|nr:preprotein translocase subunit SecA [Clostridia bacterium]
MSIISKIFGTHSDREIRRVQTIADRVDALEEKYRALSDEELVAETPRLKELLKEGKTTDDILPEAFAVCREAAWRVLGMRHYRVQVIGGIILHQGRIAEMKTGEGKTLVATLPAYLNALTGEGVHIVTVNDYLARRDSEWMGKVYNFLGLSVGLVVPGMERPEKQIAYNADITYGTNNEFGFDYLRDNMAMNQQSLVQRSHAFAIVDEVDSILIDEARTPLIISGMGEDSTDLYERADEFAKKLKKFVIKEADSKVDYDDVDADYIVDEKARTATLLKSGIEKAERFFDVENLADLENTTLSHHINQAIKARGVMQKDVDYVVKDDEVVIVDTFTGRLMIGRRYNEGLHQAIEAKEGVTVEKESKTLATITFQNYFRLYKKLSGMTGTALTEEEEFRKIYQLDVIEIPTNRPMVRVDHPDVVYKTVEGKYRALVEQIRLCHEKGQPVLVGTVSIEKSELVSRLLKREGIPHNVLNAKNHAREAEIVAQAGKFGAVTISTNMAGRGTDIRLGGNPEFMAAAEMRREQYPEELIAAADSFFETDDEEVLEARRHYAELVKKYKEEIAPEIERVKAAGGLFILGTERHESRRIDNQLRGRSGRQGDVGESRFYLSFEDDLLRLFGTQHIQGLVDRLASDETPIDLKMLSGGIETAQKQLEGRNFGIRSNVLMYDDVMNQQRTIVYRQRREVLDGADLKEKMLSFVQSFVAETVAEHLVGDRAEWDLKELSRAFYGIFGEIEIAENEDADDVCERLTEVALKRYAEQEETFGSEAFRRIERDLLLMSVDRNWMEHIDVMDDLRGSIGLQAYGQRDPVTQYKIVGGEIFEEMNHAIRNETVRNLLTVSPRKPQTERRAVKITSENRGGAADGSAKQQPVKKKASEKVGRNDPCPCGSGKKYKKCCGMGAEGN